MENIISEAKRLKEIYNGVATNTQLANLCDKYANFGDMVVEKLKHFESGFINVKGVEDNNKLKTVVNAKDGVACVIFNKRNNKVLLVKQYRVAMGKGTWEIPAGIIEDNENALSAIVREINEECELDYGNETLNRIFTYCPAIGYSSQKVSMYLMICDIEDKDSYISDNEVIEKKWVSIAEYEKMVLKGDIIDGKTIMGFYILQKNIAHMEV